MEVFFRFRTKSGNFLIFFFYRVKKVGNISGNGVNDGLAEA